MEEETWHGTRNGYDNYSCRCRLCRKANAIGKREWRERQKRKRLTRLVEEDPAPYTPERRRRLPDD